MGVYEFAVVEDWPECAQVPGDMPDVADVAVDDADTVYLLARNPGRIVVLTAAGELRQIIGAGILSNRPHGLEVASDGSILCVEERRHAVARFHLDGSFDGWIGIPDLPSMTGVDANAGGFVEQLRSIKHSAGPFNRPTHATLAADGRIFVTDGYGNAAVHRFTAGGSFISSWGSPGEQMSQFRVPHYACFIGDERLGVCDRENGRVQVFTTDGEFVDCWPAQRPAGIAYDKREELVFVAEMGTDAGEYMWARGTIGEAEPPRVTIWTTSGEQVGELASRTEDPTDPGSFILPHGIAVDSVGNVFVAETTSTYRHRRESYEAGGKVSAHGARVDYTRVPKVFHSVQKFQRVGANVRV